MPPSAHTIARARTRLPLRLEQGASELRRLLLAQQGESTRLLSTALISAGRSEAERQSWHDLPAEARSLLDPRSLQPCSHPPAATTHTLACSCVCPACNRMARSATVCAQPSLPPYAPSLQPYVCSLQPYVCRSARSLRTRSCTAAASRPTRRKRGPCSTWRCANARRVFYVCTACAPRVHCVCTTCALRVHCVCTACAMRVHCVCAVYALRVRRKCAACVPRVAACSPSPLASPEPAGLRPACR